MADTAALKTIETQIPSRMDRLPWSGFHRRIVAGLGTVWILDGLEVTIVGAIGARLTENGSGVGMNAADVGYAAASYVAGACLGALFFGQLTDRFGRKKLMMITLGLYILATVATAFAFAPWYFFLFRFFTGAGIGGEYSAINSAIDELIPARNRGQVDITINGSFWVGSAIGSFAALLFLSSLFPTNIGWRIAFGVGAVLGMGIFLVRRTVPESPRWLFIHGREEEAERIVDGIEKRVEEKTRRPLPEPKGSITVRQRKTVPFTEIGKVAFKYYPRRAILGLALFVGQAFLYNAVTFDLGTILKGFYGVSSSSIPYYTAVFAVGNFMGPLLLGRYFDSIGRRFMISTTYLLSSALTVLLAVLVITGALGNFSFIGVVAITFFFASAGASSAYLTVSEIFPMETRALAIAFFYAVGTGVGGITGPLLFGNLINSGNAAFLGIGFLIGAVVMSLGGFAEVFFGVKAERTQLENIAKPLTAADAEQMMKGGPTMSGEAAPVEKDVPGRERKDVPAAADGRPGARGETKAVPATRTAVQALRLGRHMAPADRAGELAQARQEETLAAGARERASEVQGVEAELARLEADMHQHLAEMHVEWSKVREAQAASDTTAEAEHEQAAKLQEQEAFDDQERLEDVKLQRTAPQARRPRRSLRPYLPGPATGDFYSPGMLGTASRWAPLVDEELVRSHIDAIARVLEERGPTARAKLMELVGGRYWGPGRFRAVLREAVAQGRVKQLSRNQFGPADQRSRAA